MNIWESSKTKESYRNHLENLSGKHKESSLNSAFSYLVLESTAPKSNPCCTGPVTTFHPTVGRRILVSRCEYWRATNIWNLEVHVLWSGPKGCWAGFEIMGKTSTKSTRVFHLKLSTEPRVNANRAVPCLVPCHFFLQTFGSALWKGWWHVPLEYECRASDTEIISHSGLYKIIRRWYLKSPKMGHLAMP